MRAEARRTARALAVCILAAWTMLPVRAAEDKDVVKEIKTRLEATVVAVNDVTVRDQLKMTVGDSKIVATTVGLYKANKYRLELETLGLPGPTKQTIIFDGRDQWLLADGVRQKQPDALPNDKGVFWWRAIPDNADIQGTEKLGGRECYVVQYRPPKAQTERKLWVDRENLRLLRVERTSPSRQVTISYFDYRKIRGDWELAHKREAQVLNHVGIILRERMTSEVISVQVNTGLGDDLFDAGAAK